MQKYVYFPLRRMFTVLALLAALAMSSAYVSAADEELAGAIESLKTLEPVQPRKVLIFSLTNGYKHKSIPVGIKALSLVGEKTGAYEAVVSNDLANFEPENIQQFDAICFLNTTLEVFSPHRSKLKTMSEERKQVWQARELRLKASFIDFIKSGKGFIGIHSATDTFYQWPEYGDMIGAYFDGHPWRSNRQVHIKVEDGQQDHCCMKHVNAESLSFKEEIYQFKAPYDVNKLQVILRLDPLKNDLSMGKRSDNDYPVSWVKHYAKGRVFYSSLGHNNHIFSNPKVLQHFINGIQWSLGDLPHTLE